MHRLKTVFLLVALLTAAAIATAQTVTEEPTEDAAPADDLAAYADRDIMFRYPADWAINDGAATDAPSVALGTTANALDATTFEEFDPGDVQVLIVKNAEPFFAQRLGIQLMPGVTATEALVAVVPEELEVLSFAFDDGREAAEVIFSDPDADADTVIWLVDLGDGDRGAMLITGRAEDVDAIQDDLLAIAESFVAAEVTVAGITEDGVVLDLTYTNTPGNRQLSYPDGWLIVENQRGAIFVATSGEALNTDVVSELERGEVVALLYPSYVLIPEYPPGSREPSPADVVTFFTALGLSGGYEPVGIMEALPQGDAESAVSLSVNRAQAHERLIISIDTGDDVATILAYTRVGGMGEVRPVLEAISTSIVEGDFAVPTEEAPTTTEEPAATEDAP